MPTETHTDTAELRKLMEAATSLPWAADDNDSGNVISVAPSEHHPALGSYSNVCISNHRDAALIVAAVNALPGLLARVEEMEAALHEVVRLDHHNMGPGSRATTIARVALKGAQKP